MIGEHVPMIAMLAAGIGTIVACVAWIDARIERRIMLHEREDSLRHEAILAAIRAHSPYRVEE